MADARTEAAERFEAMAAELERATGHCRVAAGHYREGDIPRAAAHAFAAYGHLLRGQAGLEEAARVHASKSLLPADAEG